MFNSTVGIYQYKVKIDEKTFCQIFRTRKNLMQIQTGTANILIIILWNFTMP